MKKKPNVFKLIANYIYVNRIIKFYETNKVLPCALWNFDYTIINTENV